MPRLTRIIRILILGWYVSANKSPGLDGVTENFCPPPKVCSSGSAVNLSAGWAVPARRGMGWVLYRNYGNIKASFYAYGKPLFVCANSIHANYAATLMGGPSRMCL